jgi:hypothetical protein
MSLIPQQDEDLAPVKVKAFDVECARVKMEKVLEGVANIMKDGAKKCKAALEDADKASAGRTAGERAVPWQQRYIDLAHKRMELLDLVAGGVPDEDAPPGGSGVAAALHKLGLGLQDSLSYVKTTGEDTEPTPQVISDRIASHISNLPAMPDGRHEACLKVVLMMAEFQESCFVRQCFDYPLLGKALMKLGHSVRKQACLLDWVAARRQLGEPVPIADAAELVPQYSLGLQGTRLRLISSDHHMKEFLAELKSISDSWKRLIAIVEKGAKQVCDNILDHDKQVEKKKGKEEEDIKKKAEKEDVKKQKDAEKRAKKEALTGEVGAGKQVFLLSSSDGIADVEEFADAAAFIAKRTSDGDKFRPGVPYIVREYDTLLKLTDQRSVKAAIGLFRIQFAALAGKPGHKGFGNTAFLGRVRKSLNFDVRSHVNVCFLIFLWRLIKYD